MLGTVMFMARLIEKKEVVQISKYKGIWDKTRFSFSALRQYDECPYALYLTKIVGEKGIGNGYAEIGTYGHDLLERVFSRDITIQDALDECIEEFDDHITEDIPESSKDKKYEALCDYLAEFDEGIFDNYEVLGTEIKCMWQIGKEKFIGFIDLVLKDKETGKIYLVDHKSSDHFMKKDGKTPLKSKESSFNSYKKQMYLYADAMKKILGYLPDYIMWNHFLDRGETTVIPFDEGEYKDVLKWAEQTINGIRSDDEFKAIPDFFRCTKLCNHRETCPYIEDEDVFKKE